MRAPARLGLYGLILVTVFAVAGFTANTVIPEDVVQNWAEDTDGGDQHGQGGDVSDVGQRQEQDGRADGAVSPGLGLSQGGYRLTEVHAPTETGTEGELSLVVTGPDGSPARDFELDHEQEMHLITVRADGRHFRHVHPERGDDGTWSIPWGWDEGGTYRIFADFVPSETGKGTTLSTTVQVAGDYAPVPAEPAASTTVDGFEVTVDGELEAGGSSELTMTLTRDGEPVTELEPYMGAFGHLVALRDGDLAYLHVHPHEEEPAAGETSGPEISFEAAAPTSGRYLLYLDFQVDGQVHTAPLVVDTTGVAEAVDAGGGSADEDSGASDIEHAEGDGHDH